MIGIEYHIEKGENNYRLNEYHIDGLIYPVRIEDNLYN